MHFEVAEVLSFVVMAYVGGSATSTEIPDPLAEGCGYVFHDDHQFLNFSGTWEGSDLRWAVPPAVSGVWDLERAAGSHDNAAVMPDGALRERPPSSPPADPPPTAGLLEPSPPAWIETKRGTFWLGFGASDRRQVPKLMIERGEIVRAHLPFIPQRVRVTAFPTQPPSTPQELDHHRHFPTSDEIVWRVDRAGAFTLTAAAREREGGDVSYVACAELW